MLYLLSKMFYLFPALGSINSSHSRCACSFLKPSSMKGKHLQTYRKFNLAYEVGQLHKMLIFFILKLLNTFPDADQRENNKKYNGAICGRKRPFKVGFWLSSQRKNTTNNNANIRLRGLFIDMGMLIINNHFV